MTPRELTRDERTERLADLRAREAARKVVLRGVPLMDLPLQRRIAFAIYDPGAITPRGDDYTEPLYIWQARAVAYVLPEPTAELERLKKRVAELEALVEAMCAALTGHDCPDPTKGPMETVTSAAIRLMEAEARVNELEAAARPAILNLPPNRQTRRLLAEGGVMTADEFNARYPVGTPVTAYPGCRPEDDANDERLVTRTRSKAEVLGGHTDVVWVDGHSACIALSHIDPVEGGERP